MSSEVITLPQSRLELDVAQPDWEHMLAEVSDDDPLCTLDTLSAAEKARVELHIIGASHTPDNAVAIGEAMSGADYYIREAFFGEEETAVFGTRSNNDIATNIVAGGGTVWLQVPAEESGASHRVPMPANASYLEAVRIARAHNEPQPIYRTIDADSNMPAPAELLDHFATMGDLDSYIEALNGQYNESLYFEPNDTLLEELQKIFTLTRLSGLGRERVQGIGISTIIANAVRRHPEMSRIRFKVMIGATHVEAHDDLVHDPALSADATILPAAYKQSLSARLLHIFTRTGQPPAPDQLKQVLLYDYAVRMTAPDFPLQHMRAAEELLQTFVEGLSPEDVNTALGNIETIKQTARQTLPDFARGTQELANWATGNATATAFKKDMAGIPGLFETAKAVQAINNTGTAQGGNIYRIS